MAITKTIPAPISATPIVASLPALDRANLSTPVVNSKIENGVWTQQTIWRWEGGDSAVRTTLKLEFRRNPKAGVTGESVVTVAIYTKVIADDDVTELTSSLGDCRCTISTAMPGVADGDHMPDNAEWFNLVAVAFTSLFNAVDGSNVPDTEILNKLAFTNQVAIAEPA